MRNKLKIGCHLSASDGYLAMGKEAVAMNADTFAFFTRNPRGGAAKEIKQADVDAFLAFAAENGISQLVAHSPYTLNPCSSNEHTRQFALDTMKDDLLRMEYTPGNMYNFHPGSHTGQGVEVGIEEIAFLLNTTCPTAHAMHAKYQTVRFLVIVIVRDVYADSSRPLAPLKFKRTRFRNSEFMSTAPRGNRGIPLRPAEFKMFFGRDFFQNKMDSCIQRF